MLLLTNYSLLSTWALALFSRLDFPTCFCLQEGLALAEASTTDTCWAVQSFSRSAGLFTLVFLTISGL